MTHDIRRTSRILFVTYMIAIGTLCLMNTDSLPTIPKMWLGIPADKIAHFCMFAPFTALAYLSMLPEKVKTWKGILAVIVLAGMGAAFAYGTEMLQGMTGYRSYDIDDFYADMAGLAAGAVFIAIFIIIRNSRGRKG